MPGASGKQNHCQVLGPGGRGVYILGGREGADNGVSSVYRLEGGAWLQQASMAVPRMDFACVEHQVGDIRFEEINNLCL